MNSWLRSDLLALASSKKSEAVFAVFALAICFVTIYLEPDTASSDNGILRYLQWIPLFTLAGWAVLSSSDHLMKLQFQGNPFWWIVLLFCACSAVWSDQPAAVLKRSVQNLGMVFIVIATAWHFHDRMASFYGKLLWLLGALLWVSVGVAVLVPNIGIETAVGIVGTWRGIMGQKNLLGIFCALAFYWCSVCWHQKSISTTAAIMVWVPATVCLLMSKSSTSAMLTVTSVAVYFFLARFRIRSNALLLRAALVFLLLVILVVLAHYFVESSLPSSQIFIEPISELFGKESHLTGRADIWEIMWGLIAQHPVLGMGHASFWLGPGGPSQFVSDLLRWSVPTAHNGYLEILNEIGLVGMSLFVAALLWHVVNLARLASLDRTLAASHVGVLVIFLISNFSESTALRMFEYLQISLATSMCMAVFQLQSATQAVLMPTKTDHVRTRSSGMPTP